MNPLSRDVIKELLNITNQFQEYEKRENVTSNRIMLSSSSTLFSNDILFDYIVSMIPIAITHLPHLFPVKVCSFQN